MLKHWAKKLVPDQDIYIEHAQNALMIIPLGARTGI